MKKRRVLGQHLLRKTELLDKIIEHSEISRNSTVLEIGTGEGYLTEKLCSISRKVISIEIDKRLFEIAEKRLNQFKNLELILGDFLENERQFDILVSNLPYSKSSKFIEWLCKKNFDHALVTVQSEFANKLLSESGEHNYRSITVLSRYRFEIHKLFEIDSLDFTPPPKIRSTVLFLKPIPNRDCDKELIFLLKKIFSYRKRKVLTAMKIILKKDDLRLKMINKTFSDRILQQRVEKLTIDDAIYIAKVISGSKYE
jgi:16S rRNA (adenine1518-N6/adenine1519-N6)-dimethyltransferase